ncbi:MAG TPA: hypothetical protein VHV53_10995 [Solirubrobacterales bacterium]|jgi:hypothetical protein|nr:hypothetical protein [Solirubrobacterales bacterium]
MLIFLPPQRVSACGGGRISKDRARLNGGIVAQEMDGVLFFAW